jgi:outer membrane lipoprotein-sorting protein
MRLLFVGLLAVCAGCAHQQGNLPTYRWAGDQAALRELSDRAHAVKSVSSECLLTLTRPDGNSVRLDGAIVLSMPQQSVRLRTWKFNQPVFDLTLTPQGLWIKTPHDSGRRQQVLPARVSAAQLAHALSIFGGEVFDGPRVKVMDSGGAQFQVKKPLDDGQIMTADVNRATLTVHSYALSDSNGATHFRLTLKDYRAFNGILWPTHLLAQSDGGTIDVELHDLELNGDLPAAAFVPPHGAEKVQ